MKKIDYLGLTIRIHYDPIESLYYCGIPGYTIPTIFVGTTETGTREFVEDELKNYIDFCKDQGSCHETEIRYDVQEAYTTGWIILTSDSQTQMQDQPLDFERQKLAKFQGKQIEDFINSIDESHPDYFEVLAKYEMLEKTRELRADTSSKLQHTRMKLLNLAEKTGKDYIKEAGIEIFKVKRLGIQKPFQE